MKFILIKKQIIMIRLNMNKVMIVEKIKNLKLKDKEKLKKKIYL